MHFPPRFTRHRHAVLRTFLRLLLLLLPSAVPEPAAAESNASPGAPGKNSSFFTPRGDLEGLRHRGQENPDLPNVLLIGDSISVGYTAPVVELLKGAANVSRPPVNCGDTDAGLAGLTQWLGKKKWDVIHFNWGLHDLCYRNPEVQNVGHRDKVNGTQSVPPDLYEKNLELLVGQLQRTGAKLIWASTTVVPEGEAGRFKGDDVKYNQIARKVMDRHGIPVDDLHALTEGFGGKHSRKRGDVHFTKEGSDIIAAQVADSIRALGLDEK